MQGGKFGAAEINFQVCFTLTLDVVKLVLRLLSQGQSIWFGAEISSCADNTPALRTAIMPIEISQLTKVSGEFFKGQITNHSNEKT
jgi:hypothetical protein